MKTNLFLAIDQSTSATKAMLFNTRLELVNRVNIPHKQYYPQPGFVEHDPMEILRNTKEAVRVLLSAELSEVQSAELFEVQSAECRVQSATAQPNSTFNFQLSTFNLLSLCITNQRETFVLWDKQTGLPVHNAVVWQCNRGKEICQRLIEQGHSQLVRERTGLPIDPYFSATGLRWLLDNIPGAQRRAERGELLFGTMECWLVWNLTDRRVHATDATNAARTMLLNINALQWDEDILRILNIPACILPKVQHSDEPFGETTFDGLLPQPIPIASAIGDSHAALVGQMCFSSGQAKATYGTGSSVMINIGSSLVQSASAQPNSALCTLHSALNPACLTIAYAAQGKVYYALEGNIHSAGATIKFLQEQLHVIDSPMQAEQIALSIPDNQGVYIVPAFAGLAAPYWRADVKAAISGLTFQTTNAHLARAAIEAIAYQVADLVHAIERHYNISLTELRVDGGPTKNNFLMQLQADTLRVPVNAAQIEEASALGAVILAALAQGIYKDTAELQSLRVNKFLKTPADNREQIDRWMEGWHNAVNTLISNK